MFRLPIGLLALLCLASCAALVPSTALQLAQTDPLTADPAAIELSLTLPPGLAVIPGTARLTLSATRGAQSVSGEFTLDQRSTSQTTRTFALTPADVPRMRALQSQIAQWKAEGPAKGSLGLGIGGCAIGPGPDPDARGSASIRLAKDGPLLPLIRNGALSDLIGAEALASIAPCAGPG